MSRTLFLAALVAVACGGGGGAGNGGGPPPNPDRIPPQIAGTSPAESAPLATLDAPLTITFSEAVDPGTVSGETVQVTCGGAAVAGTLAVNGPSVTFTPLARWDYDERYLVTVTTGVRDAAGNALAAAQTWSFYTLPAAGYRPSPLAGVSPAEGATGVAPDVVVTFSLGSALDVSTLTLDNVRLTREGQPIAGLLSAESGYATFTPTAFLADGATYTVTLRTGLRTAAGAQLEREYGWSFTTRAIAGTPVEVSRSSSEVAEPRVAANAAGDVVVAWLQSDGTTDYYAGPHYDVYAARRPAGGAWGAPQRVSRVGRGPAMEPLLGCGTDGACLLVWREYDAGGSWSSRVWSSAYAPGSGWSAPATVDADGAIEWGLMMTTTPELGAELAWASVSSSPSGALQLARFAPATGWVARPVPPARDSSWQAALNASGAVVRAWAEGGHVFADESTAGPAWAGPVEIDDATDPSYAAAPTVAVGPAGDAIAVWAQGGQLRFNRYVPAAGWGTPGAIAAVADLYRVDALAIDGAGRALVLFTSAAGEWGSSYAPGAGWSAAVADPVQAGLGTTALDMAASGRAAQAWPGAARSDPTGLYGYAWLREYAPETGWSAPVAVGGLGHAASTYVSVKAARYGADHVVVAWSKGTAVFANCVK